VFVTVGVNVIVDVTVEVIEGMGVIVETAITVFPILQLTRTKKHHKRRKNFFAMTITSVIVSLLFCALLLVRPTACVTRLGWEGGLTLETGVRASQKNA
jgi:hypothetical protein